MKLPKAFLTKKKLDDKTNNLNEGRHSHGLAIAVGIFKEYISKGRDVYSTEGQLYVWESSMRHPQPVKKREFIIFDLCYFNNKLYDCGAYKKIYDTLLDKVLVDNSCTPGLCANISAMSYYENSLIFSCFNQIFSYHINLKNVERIATRPEKVYALEVHKNIVYDAGHYGIYKTLEKNPFIGKPARALCSHKGNLYCAGFSYPNSHIYEASTWNMVTERNSLSYALCSFENRLLDGGSYCFVADSFSDKITLNFDYPVTALETIPISLVKELIKTS